MLRGPTRLFAIKFLGLWGASSLESFENGQGKEKKSQLIISGIPSSESKEDDKRTDYKLAIAASEKNVLALLLEKGVPGLTVCVSKRGETVWKAAFGFCDVENQLPCEPDAQMRIASISKTLFATTVVAPLLEGNKIDLQTSIHRYLTADEFPKQKFEAKEYDITIGQLLSHTSGIRHYPELPESVVLRSLGSPGSKKVFQTDDQYNRVGFYQRTTYRNVIDALKPFKDEPLVCEPGKFHYSTYGYTLLSAVIQKVLHGQENSSKEQIEDFWMKVLHRDWDMRNTHLDLDEVIIPKRARYYMRTSLNGGLVNAPFSDNSIKWAGGGLISTTGDLIKFADQVIDCYKGTRTAKLKRETIDLLWREVQGSYALGFKVKLTESKDGKKKIAVLHEGGAAGASSVLIIYPDSEIAVAILTNIGSVGLAPLGFSIADEFDK